MWNVLSLSTKISLLKRINLFLRGSLLRNWAYKTDDWSRWWYYFRWNCLWRQQSREKIVGLLGTNLFQIFNCVFVPTFCDFVDYLRMLPPRQESHSQFLFGSKMEPFKQKLTKITFFLHSPSLHVVMQKEIENLEFVQGVNFELRDSLKNNGTKGLLIFYLRNVLSGFCS